MEPQILVFSQPQKRGKIKLGKATFLINITLTKCHLTWLVNSHESIFLFNRNSEADNEWYVFRIYGYIDFSFRINSLTDLYQRMMAIEEDLLSVIEE